MRDSGMLLLRDVSLNETYGMGWDCPSVCVDSGCTTWGMQVLKRDYPATELLPVNR